MNANHISKIPTSQKFQKYSAALAVLFLLSNPLAAQTPVVEPTPVYYNNVFVGLCVAILFLLVAILALGELVKAAAKHRSEKEKGNVPGSGIKRAMTLLILFGLLTNSASAQSVLEDTAPYVEFNYWGLGSGLFYLLVSIIGFEIWIVWALYGTAMQLIGRDRKETAKALVKQPTLMEKLNASVAIEKEKDIMFDHSYDGIRELDNDLPPWWKYGFYATIVFSVIYLFNYHVGGGKLQIAEYQDQMDKAKIELEEYRKKAANLVDENNATTLTDAASLASGKNVYLNNCAACHGQAGEGGVGPNLTDDYWLHKGGIRDIFRSIKLGWPEKGMKSWQQDLGARQIHEVASYIRSLKGTKPANGKEQQGELYQEEVALDSTQIAAIKDSIPVIVKEK